MGKVLILGAKGMLGHALVRVFGSSLNPPLNVRGAGGVIEKTELFAWDRDECDITNADLVAKKIGELAPAIILNAAAYNNVDGAEKDATLSNKINGDAVGYLASAAASVGATFVHYSTDYVFDGTKKDGYREDDIPIPISEYGRSKLAGEQKLLLSLRGVERRGNPTVYLIRTSRLFGKQGSGKQSFIDLMLALAKTTEDRPLESRGRSSVIEVVDEELSSPTYVEDLAQRTREIIEQKKPSGIYHVMNSGACTWYGFAQEIFSAKGGSLPTGQAGASGGKLPMITPVPSSRFPRPAKRPAYSQLLNTKLPPLRSWQEALSVYLSEKI